MRKGIWIIAVLVVVILLLNMLGIAEGEHIEAVPEEEVDFIIVGETRTETGPGTQYLEKESVLAVAGKVTGLESARTVMGPNAATLAGKPAIYNGTAWNHNHVAGRSLGLGALSTEGEVDQEEPTARGAVISDVQRSEQGGMIDQGSDGDLEAIERYRPSLSVRQRSEPGQDRESARGQDPG